MTLEAKTSYVEKLATRLEDWRAQIDLVAANANGSQEGIRHEIERLLNEIDARWQVAESRLAELRDGNGEGWEEFRASTDEAFHSLEEGIRSAMAKF